MWDEFQEKRKLLNLIKQEHYFNTFMKTFVNNEFLFIKNINDN